MPRLTDDRLADLRQRLKNFGCSGVRTIDVEDLLADRDALAAELTAPRKRESDEVETPGEGDGTHKLCLLLYGKVQARKYVGGPNARMLHDAALEIERLRADVAKLLGERGR